MQWVELSLSCNSEQVEAISAILGKYGQGGALIEEWPSQQNADKHFTVKIYLPLSRAYPAILAEIETQVSQAGYTHRPLERILQQDEWFDSLKKNFKVMEIGQSFVIKPTWISTPLNYPGRHIIEVDPGAAFGTGLHPTTRLCISSLEKHLIPGTAVLDLGTGTGILAIAAAKLGAAKVVALDIDKVAVRTASFNIKNNQVDDKVEVKKGTLSRAFQSKNRAVFNLVIANITSRAISDFSDALMEVLKPEGVLIVSGIHPEGLDEVLIRLAISNLKLMSIEIEQDWHAVIACKETLPEK
ncbi:MAG TPA: 50S ribosomal protein L11 methyltransferase [Dehalococcoidales bacterium]|nr:50S ribosomal protein L11 methyltransferase [Dehalococcoidales bacterium]